MRKFGRLHVPDARDCAFPLRTLSQAQQLKVRRKHWTCFSPLPLDQGDTPQCVAYSCQALLLAGPVKNKQFETPAALYHAAQKIDGIPGAHEGSTVRAGLKVLSQAGYFAEYHWARSLEDVIGHVLGVGPVNFGTDWYEGMAETDKHGFLQLSGANMGGHAYLVIGCDIDRECPDSTIGALQILNSWGRAWGRLGTAWLSFKDARELLAADGEAGAGHEVKQKKGAKHE